MRPLRPHRFFTGEPCSRGHVADRYLSNGSCVECMKETARARHAANPKARRERSAAWTKAWRAKNPDKAREKDARSYAKRQKNTDADRKKSAKYRETHRELMLERTRAWRLAHPDRHRSAVTRWKSVNPEKARAHVRARRARRRGAEGHHTVEDLAQIFAAQRGRCAYCRCKLTDENKQVDHIVALTKGGSNDRRNLQYLCLSCNSSKHNRDPIEFAAKRGMLL